MTIAGVKILNLPKVQDERGNLSFLQEGNLPFEIQDICWPYDAKNRMEGYAYKKRSEIVIALSGSVEVIIQDAEHNKRTFKLSSPLDALYVPCSLWREMINYSDDVCVIHLLDGRLQEGSVIRDFKNYLNYVNA